jgi:hypothetical protein
VLDFDGKFALFYRKSFTAEQIAENATVTSVHLSMKCARDSDLRWEYM